MIHLPEDHAKWGPLDKVACFDFESFLGAYVKGKLTGRNMPLEQICRHISTQNEKISCPVVHHAQTSKKVQKGNMVFKSGNLGIRDNCIMVKDGSIGTIKIVTDQTLVVAMFAHKTAFFLKPINSQIVGIHKVSNIMDDISITSDLIYSKMLLVPKNNYYVAITLLHTV